MMVLLFFYLCGYTYTKCNLLGILIKDGDVTRIRCLNTVKDKFYTAIAFEGICLFWPIAIPVGYFMFPRSTS